MNRSNTTSACPTAPSPAAGTSEASSISSSGVQLNGTADPNGASTSAWFQWGTRTAYGNMTAATSVGSGTSPIPYNADLGALACGTTYHFQAVAQNSGGTDYGVNRSFTTSACSTSAPTVGTSPSRNVSASGAQLNGTANPNGASTSAWFEWGTSLSYGNVTSPQTNVGSGSTAVSYSFYLDALVCGSRY